MLVRKRLVTLQAFSFFYPSFLLLVMSRSVDNEKSQPCLVRFIMRRQALSVSAWNMI
jgi:hypothetical protein